MNKQDWTYKTFGEIMSPACVVRCGERKLPVLSITMRNGIVEQNERFSKSIASNDKSNYKVVKNGQLVIAFPIDEGLLYTQDVVPEGIMSPAYNIWDVDYSCINRRFLVTFFHSSFAFAYYKAKLKGTTQRRRTMDKTDLLSMPIPVPPIEEQERIVAELDLLSGIIEKKKEQIKAYDQLAQSIFYTMFGDPIDNPKGWEVKNMGDIGDLQRGSGLSKKDLTENGFPCILYGQIHTRFGAFTRKHIACIPQELVSTAKIAHFGDIVMAITSEDVEGSCKSVAWMGNYDIAVGSDAAIYRHTLNPIYVSYYTQTKAFYFEKAKYAKGFKVTHISTKEIAKIPILVPPLSLQQEFAEKIEAIERQKALVQQSIEETQTMFDYTMDKYFG